MIKNSTYIRCFSPRHRKQMEEIQEQQKIKTVPEILFFALDGYLDQQKEIQRLKRIIEYKQKKIENLKQQSDASI